jgi:hypothetical protein
VRKCLKKFYTDQAHYVIRAVISPGNSDENSDVSDFLTGRKGKMKKLREMEKSFILRHCELIKLCNVSDRLMKYEWSNGGLILSEKS